MIGIIYGSLGHSYFQFFHVTTSENNIVLIVGIMDIVFEELNEPHDYVKFCKLLGQLTSINPDEFTLEDYSKHLAMIKSNPYHKIILAIIGGEIAGTITVLIEPKFIHNLSYVSHIEDVVVDSNYRSYGVGRKLVNEAIRLSKEYKCYKVILDCNDSNVGFYNKLGFEVKGKEMAVYFH